MQVYSVQESRKLEQKKQFYSSCAVKMRHLEVFNGPIMSIIEFFTVHIPIMFRICWRQKTEGKDY